MATAIAVAALMLAAAIGTILIAPVRIVLEWDDASPAPLRARAHWLFLAWRSDPLRPVAPRAARPTRSPRPRRPFSRESGRRVRAALLARGFIPRLARLIADLLRLLLPRTASGSVRIGLDDPASTGMLYGAAHAAAGLGPSAAWDLRIAPEFTGASFTGRGRAEWVLRPGRVLWSVLAFLGSPAVWRAAWVALRPVGRTSRRMCCRDRQAHGEG